MDKTLKWILIAVLVFVVIAILIYVFQNANNQPQPPVTQPGQQPAPGNAIANILSGLFSSGWIQNLFGGGGMAAPACQANNPGFDNNGYYTRACGGVPGGGGANCNPDKPGKDMNGFNSSQCGG